MIRNQKSNTVCHLVNSVQMLTFGQNNKFTNNSMVSDRTFGTAFSTGAGGGTGISSNMNVNSNEPWCGAQRLMELRIAYAPTLDATGNAAPDNSGVRQNRYCEFVSEVYAQYDDKSNSSQYQSTQRLQKV